MAERTPILLKGGPCDGLKTTARRADFGPLSVTCKGVRYEPTDEVTKGGRLVYRTSASLHQPPGPHVAPGTKPSRAHESWHHMLRTIFVAAPKELRHAYNARAAIRRIRHRPGLR